MSDSLPVRHCIYCSEDKAWIFSGKKLKDGSKIYTNELDLRWAGRRCPDCERTRVQAAIHCDSFERELVLSQLEEAGYSILSKTLPLKVEKGGLSYNVVIRHAHTVNGQITLDKALDEPGEVYALVFNAVRICTAEQMQRLEPQLRVFKRYLHKEVKFQPITCDD